MHETTCSYHLFSMKASKKMTTAIDRFLAENGIV
jgi:hypothetical protein